jgi:hypothetical protein
LAAGRDMHQCRPELQLQCNAGATTGQGDGSLDQRASSPPPGNVAHNAVVAFGLDVAAVPDASSAVGAHPLFDNHPAHVRPLCQFSARRSHGPESSAR